MTEFDYVTPLARAIAIWEAGKHISIDLAVQLMAEGYDVPALERRHFKAR
jgi:hypothetical protein